MVDSFKKQRDALLMEKRMKKDESEAVEDEIAEEQVYTLWVKKNWATFIFTVTLSDVGRF